MTAQAEESSQADNISLNSKIEKNLENVKIDSITNKADLKEYYATIKLDNGVAQKIYVKQWQETVNGKQVWKFNAYEVNSKSNVQLQSTKSFGKDSYYWTDNSGIHFHFGPKDNALLEKMGDSGVGLICGVLAIVVPAASGYLGVFATLLITKISLVEYRESNSNGSLNVFITYKTLLVKLPFAIMTPGLQPLPVKIGSHTYNLYK